MSVFLPSIVVSHYVKQALAEDLQGGGDITSHVLFSSEKKAQAKIIAKQNGVVAGLELAKETFSQIAGENNIKFKTAFADSEIIKGGAVLAELQGRAVDILAGERTALNFLAHLSGIASLTNSFVELVKSTNAKICCTRKTIPTMRELQKYAVRCGGGVNHRFNLGDAILIKDNHIAIAGSIAKALQKAKAFAGPLTAIEIEVDELQQLEKILQGNIFPACILLDNMNISDMQRAVEQVQGKCLLEASGNITLDNVKEIAKTGVDFISTSQITQSAKALDISLDINYH